jgi:hypothetical protein
MGDKAWTDRKEFKRLHAELRVLSRDAFADRVSISSCGMKNARETSTSNGRAVVRGNGSRRSAPATGDDQQLLPAVGSSVA